MRTPGRKVENELFVQEKEKAESALYLSSSVRHTFIHQIFVEHLLCTTGGMYP